MAAFPLTAADAQRFQTVSRLATPHFAAIELPATGE